MFRSLIPVPKHKLIFSVLLCFISCLITWYGQAASHSNVTWTLMAHSVAHLLTAIIVTATVSSKEFKQLLENTPLMTNLAPGLLFFAGFASFINVYDSFEVAFIHGVTVPIRGEGVLTWVSLCLSGLLLLEKHFLPELHELSHNHVVMRGRYQDIICKNHASYDLEIKFDLAESLLGLLVAYMLWLNTFQVKTILLVDCILALCISFSMITRASLMMRK